jgi:hypothetical protein
MTYFNKCNEYLQSTEDELIDLDNEKIIYTIGELTVEELQVFLNELTEQEIISLANMTKFQSLLYDKYYRKYEITHDIDNGYELTNMDYEQDDDSYYFCEEEIDCYKSHKRFQDSLSKDELLNIQMENEYFYIYAKDLNMLIVSGRID